MPDQPVAQLSYFLSCAAGCFAPEALGSSHLCQYQDYSHFNDEEVKELVRIARNLDSQITFGRVFFRVGKRSPLLSGSPWRLYDLEEGVRVLVLDEKSISTSLAIGLRTVEIKKVLLFTVAPPQSPLNRRRKIQFISQIDSPQNAWFTQYYTTALAQVVSMVVSNTLITAINSHRGFEICGDPAGEGPLGLRKRKPSEYLQSDEYTVCQDCRCEFSLFNRRHHCRMCGQVFCGDCCPYVGNICWTYAPGKEEFSDMVGIRGEWERVCILCAISLGRGYFWIGCRATAPSAWKKRMM